MEDTKYSRERPKGSLAPQTTFTDELKGRENYQQKFKKRQPTSRRGTRKKYEGETSSSSHGPR